MEAFIEDHGHESFYDHFDEYRQAVKDYDQETVDAFLGEDFDISDISRLKTHTMDSMTAKKNLRRIS